MTVKVNTANVYAYISTAWVEITDWVLNLGDFNTLFNNYDGSILDSVCSCTISSTILDTYTIGLDTKIEIKQDGKLLLPFYISLFKNNEKDKEIETELSCVYLKLKVPMQQSVFETGIQSQVAPAEDVKLGGTSATTTLYRYPDLIEYIFNLLTGYDLRIEYIENEVYSPEWIAIDILWNMGQSSNVSGLEERRNKSETPTWLDLIQCLCSENMLFAFTNDEFVLAHFTWNASSVDLPTNIYENDYLEETMDLTRYLETSWSEMSFNNMHYYVATTSPYYWATDLSQTMNTSYNNNLVSSETTGVSITKFNNMPFVIYYIDGLNEWCAFSVQYLHYSKNRFKQSRDLTTLVSDIYDDIMIDTQYFYQNINTVEYIFIDGRYFSKIEYRSVS